MGEAVAIVRTFVQIIAAQRDRHKQIWCSRTYRGGAAISRLENSDLPPTAATRCKWSRATSFWTCERSSSVSARYQRSGFDQRREKSSSLIKTGGASGAYEPYSRLK